MEMRNVASLEMAVMSLSSLMIFFTLERGNCVLPNWTSALLLIKSIQP